MTCAFINLSRQGGGGYRPIGPQGVRRWGHVMVWVAQTSAVAYGSQGRRRIRTFVYIPSDPHNVQTSPKGIEPQLKSLASRKPALITQAGREGRIQGRCEKQPRAVHERQRVLFEHGASRTASESGRRSGSNLCVHASNVCLGAIGVHMNR